MSRKIKFLTLLLMSIFVPSMSLWIFLQTDFSQSERAYFHDYPYLNITATKNQKIPPVPLNSTALEKDKASILGPVKTIAKIQAKIKVDTEVKIQRNIKKTIPILIKGQIHPKIVRRSGILKITKTQKTAETPKINRYHDAKLGYKAYEKKDFKTAIKFFEQALIKAPNNNALREQLSYSYKKSSQNSQAIKMFKSTIDYYQEAKDRPAPFALRREVEQLENRLELNSYAIYRDESSNTRPLSGPDLTQSQAGVEFVYQPKNIGYNNGRKFQIYGRMLTAMKRHQFTPDPQSYQAGLGVRFKAFSNHNLVLSLERLIKVGDFARNDWMVRAGYSLDHGTDYRENKKRWWSYSLYFDAALIRPMSKPDIFLTSQIIGGRNFILTKGIVLQPRITALATWQKNPFHKTSLYEAGPGLNLRTYFNQTKYEAYRSYIDMTAEYRFKLSGNSIGGSGSVVSLSIHF